MEQQVLKRLLLWLIAVIAIVSIAQVPAISQTTDYHHFADERSWLGVPNFGNVISNLPFFIIGLAGIVYVANHRNQLADFYWGGLTFSIGVLLVAFGSGYYHWAPSNETLLWDRLPMTIGFMGLYALIVSAFVKVESGVRLLPWLIVAGILSVLYWYFTESIGKGDLRWYALVQFLPMVLTLCILVMFKVEGLNRGKLVMVLCWYGVAKLLEMGDVFLLDLTSHISGHSLKHVAAAIACYFVLSWLKSIVLSQSKRAAG